MSSRKKHHFKPNWLTWKIHRQDRTFRVHVVEPKTISPKDHPKIFLAALQLFLPSTETEYLEDSTPAGWNRRPSAVDRFDLLTFPELFLPSDTLVEVLRQIGNGDLRIGCVHTGLRPPGLDANATHLFQVKDLHDLTEDLKRLPNLATEDLNHFNAWLVGQQRDERFNIGCLFTVDAGKQLRVCLHAKLVKSQDEVRPEHDRDMKEANLLSLVTLKPDDDELLPITIQPLICSDVLDLQTDDPKNHPIEAMTSHRSCFRTLHSDHIDVVSVATCTATSRVGKDTGQLEWKQKFRDAFKRSAADDRCRRHQFAAFVLANYRYVSTIPSETPGGLSGIFLPMPVFGTPFSEYVSKTRNILCHRPHGTEAADAEEDERWESVETIPSETSQRHVLGYVVSLDPDISRDSVAIMFGLTVTRLPRDANRWQRRGGVSDFKLYHLTSSSETGEALLQFKPLKPRGDS